MLPKTTSISLDDAATASLEDAATTTTWLISKASTLQSLAATLSKQLGLPEETLQAMLQAKSPASTFVGRSQLMVATLPETVSRNNHPWSVHDITQLLSGSIKDGSKVGIIFCGDSAVDYAAPLTLAVAKAMPLYSQKTNSDAGSKTGDDDTVSTSITISFWNGQGELQTPSPEVQTAATAAAASVQLAQRWVDMPPAELTTDRYAAECQELCQQLGSTVQYSEIVGPDLDAKGYGGIYGVGKAATCPPRLVILEYTPENYDSASAAAEQTCLVGKAIVYDTGGLSLKPKVGMCGMKVDMGGSAGVLGGFAAAVRSGYPHKLTCLLCVAENAIGPQAFRNDDILTLYSGKTVEVNNCDAEGRLVLGDGVAHATKHVENVNLIVDMATLTGAQGVATGQKHAAVLANTPELEQTALQAGLKSGDLAYPLLYAPDLLMKEFDSTVADMKNSVKDRSNAQSSCAGHFIEAHLGPGYKGGWLHIDMAGPADFKERATGYGVGLVLSLLKVPGF